MYKWNHRRCTIAKWPRQSNSHQCWFSVSFAYNASALWSNFPWFLLYCYTFFFLLFFFFFVSFTFCHFRLLLLFYNRNKSKFNDHFIWLLCLFVFVQVFIFVAHIFSASNIRMAIRLVLKAANVWEHWFCLRCCEWLSVFFSRVSCIHISISILRTQINI